MNRKCLDPDELRWQRRDDAHTLARAEQIKADKERYKGAVLGAKEIAQEEIERVKGIAKVAGMKTPKAPPQSVEQPVNSVPNATVFDKRGYRNPATIGRF